jgi:pSer/pThr/pTyr-binding forkhead associated (FHA) protein
MARITFEKKNVRLLETYFEDSRRLGAEDFIREHGGAFLVHHGPVGEFEPPEDLKNTIKIESSAEGAATGSAMPFNPKKDFAVFPILHGAAGASEEDLIWVGRSEENDVVIPDESVSAVHAFIRKGDEGGLYLQDMNSLNGSFINNETVPPQGMGEPVELQSGARVRFGSVKLTFLKTPEFLNLVTQLRE